MYVKYSVHDLTLFLSVTKNSRVILCAEVIAVYSKNHKSTLCRRNTEMLITV
jgi:hypothetical protein